MMPVPEGEPLGTIRHTFVDKKRPEVVTDAPGDHRRLVVQLFYPMDPRVPAAKLKTTKRYEVAPYLAHFDALKPALGPMYRDNADALTALQIPALEAAPVRVGKRIPIVIFSPGLGTSRLFYTSQILAIASRGFVVAAIDHTYDVDGVVCDGGELVRRHDPEASEVEGRVQPGEGLHAGPRLKVWSEDVRFVLDSVLALDKKDKLFRGRLDTKRIGYVGHCFGARAVVLAAATDPRVSAVIAENPWPLALESKAKTLRAKLLFAQGARTSDVVWLESQGAAATDIAKLTKQRFDEQKRFLETLGVPVWHVEFDAQEHMDFTDLPMLGAWIATRTGDAKIPEGSPQRTARRDLVDGFFVDFLAHTLLDSESKQLQLEAGEHEGFRLERFGGS